MTKEQWRELSDKQKWDIQVALRGPDCANSETIKWFTTAVIRGQMRGVMRVGGTINEDLQLVIIPHRWARQNLIPKEMVERVRDMPQICFWNSNHFFQHIIEAASHIGVPVGWVDNEVWLGAIHYGAIKAGKMFLESLSTFPDNSPSIIKELKRHLMVRDYRVFGEEFVSSPPPSTPSMKEVG